MNNDGRTPTERLILLSPSHVSIFVGCSCSCNCWDDFVGTRRYLQQFSNQFVDCSTNPLIYFPRILSITICALRRPWNVLQTAIVAVSEPKNWLDDFGSRQLVFCLKNLTSCSYTMLWLILMIIQNFHLWFCIELTIISSHSLLSLLSMTAFQIFNLHCNRTFIITREEPATWCTDTHELFAGRTLVLSIVLNILKSRLFEKALGHFFELSSEEFLVLWHETSQNCFPVLIQELVHRATQLLVAVEKILKAEGRFLWLELNSVFGDVEIAVFGPCVLMSAKHRVIHFLLSHQLPSNWRSSFPAPAPAVTKSKKTGHTWEGCSRDLPRWWWVNHEFWSLLEWKQFHF